MDEVIQHIIYILRGMWQRRWIGVAVAWGLAIVGAAAISRVQDRYEATATVFVDTSTLLRPLLSGLAVEPDINQQVAMVARTLITRPNIESLVAKPDLGSAVRGQPNKDALIDHLMRQIRFSASGRDNVFRVSYQDSDRELAQRVVQAVVTMFVETGLGSKRRDTEASRKFIDEQIASYEKRLQEAENRLKEFRLRNLSVSGGLAGGQDFAARTAAASEELARARLELRVAEQSRDALKRELSGEQSSIPSDRAAGGAAAGASPEIDARIEAQKRQLDELLRRYTDEHPEVAQIRRLIASLEDQRRQEIEARRSSGGSIDRASQSANPVYQRIRIALSEAEANVAALQARASELQARVDQLRASAVQVPRVEAELAQLNRDYEVIRQSYQQLVSRRESAALTGEVDESAVLAEFRVIDPPRVGDQPVFPNRIAIVPLMLALAITAGAGAAFAVSQLMPTIHTARALKDIAGRPVLGSISLRPSQSMLRRRRISGIGFATSVAGLVAIYGSWTLWLAISLRS